MPPARCERRRHEALASWALLGAWLSCAGCGGTAPDNPRRPNVVIISLDTTRADRLSCYGYERQTSPNLDRLAATSTVYTHAIATSSWTLPSHASLFTGKLTSSHGARFDPDGPLHLGQAIDGPFSGFRARGLSDAEVTLAERLRDAGYQTGAIVAGPWMKRVFGLAQGFDFYDDDHITNVDGRRADSVTDSALRWLARRDSRPFFLFLNYFDPHGPYQPPAPYDRMFLDTETGPGDDEFPQGELLLKTGPAPPQPPHAGTAERAEMARKEPEKLKAMAQAWIAWSQKKHELLQNWAASGRHRNQPALYDAEIHYMDTHIGRLLEHLEDDAAPDLIIVVGDHGELLGEHGLIGHGEHLYQEELHIPLIVADPGATGGTRVSRPIQPTDLMPLVLSKVGLESPAGIQGGAPGTRSHPVVAELYPTTIRADSQAWRALFAGPWKLLWSSTGRHQLFHLDDDPGESRNLIEAEGERAERMLTALDGYVSTLPGPAEAGPPQQLDEETRRALESLGYIQ